MVLTASGLIYDHGDIGKIRAAIYPTPNKGELLCDGSPYIAADYSPDGIPYSRLQSILLNNGNSTNIPLFGTGPKYSTAYVTAVSGQIMLCTNAVGAVTKPTDGTTSTAFTFNTSTTPGNVTTNYNVYSDANGVVTAISTFKNGTNGSASAAAGTSGMSNFADNHPPKNNGNFYEFSFQASNAASLGNGSGTGKYFTYSDHSTNYYVWYQTATESDPAPGGTGIKVNLTANPTGSVTDVATATANAMNGFQTDSFNCVAASYPIPGGAYFTFQTNYNAPTVTYTPWYKVNGVGSAPVGALNPIQITLLGSESAASVANLTQLAINSLYFCVPNLQGVFLRGFDPTFIWDIDGPNRFLASGAGGGFNGSNVGTFELDQIYAHNHPNSYVGGQDAAGATVQSTRLGGNASTQLIVTSTYAGGTESRPVNFSVNWMIKY